MNIAIYSEQIANVGGAEKYGLMLVLPLVGLHAVTVYHMSDEFDYTNLLRNRFNLDLAPVAFRHVHSHAAALREMRGADLVVNITDASLLPNVGKKGIMCVYFPIPLDDYPTAVPFLTRTAERARQWAVETLTDRFPSLMVPRPLGFREYVSRNGLAAGLLRSPAFLARSLAWRGSLDHRYGVRPVRTYDRLIACSRFGGEWVRKNYGVEACVLYPPIETGLFRPGAKAQEIIAVGRFDNSEKSKKFHVLVEMFKRLYGEGTLNGWTMHCCGGLHGPATEAYLASLRASAVGYPIEFHPDIAFGDLRRRYASATMFWHAMGYGEDINLHPWRFEHFGMTTVEAMAAGCIPVVINAGGQPEIVEATSQGYRWDTLEQFASSVVAVVRMSPAARRAMQEAARERATYFGGRAFFERATDLYSQLGVESRMPDDFLLKSGAAG